MSGVRAHVLWRPLAGWAALVVLVGLSVLLGSHGLRLVPIGIAGVQVAIVALVFMRLIRAEGVVRLAALTGVVWAGFLFLLTFADLLTR